MAHAKACEWCGREPETFGPEEIPCSDADLDTRRAIVAAPTTNRDKRLERCRQELRKSKRLHQ
jgi:hypothetical protein